MTWYTLIDPGLCGRLCLTLLHSLWQISALAFVVWCIDQIWRNSSVERRYTVNVAALMLALLALPMTFLLFDVAKPEINVNKATIAVAPILSTKSTTPLNVSTSNQPVLPTMTQSLGPQVTQSRIRETTTTIDAPVLNDSPASKSSMWHLLTPWIFGLYVAGVVLMFARLIVASIRANRLRAHAVLVTEGPLVEVLRSLSQQWSMKVVPALARVEQIVVPKVVGIARPTILLPASAICGLSTDELEMILAHELAHVRRYDMWVNLIQRVSETVLFFNPALWYLSRRVSVLREYCCDEMACQVQPGTDSEFESRVRYATTLLRIAEMAKRSTTTTIDLSALAASGRSPSEIRRRVARLFGEPLREPLRISRSGVFALFTITFALLLAPLVSNSTAQITPKDVATDNKTANKPVQKPSKVPVVDKKSVRTFQLNVVGPDSKPVPHVLVEIRMSAAPTAEQILRGEYVRASTYGPFAKTDAAGRLKLEIPVHPQRLNLKITKSGYGPYWAGWSSAARPLDIPDEFTAKLDKAWTVGGIIVNEAGQPVAGAKVSFSFKYKKRPGDTSSLGFGRNITTDEKGQWWFENVPTSKNDVHITVNHPDYSPLRRRLPRNGFEIKESRKPIAPIVLKSGLIVSGIVSDEDGEPIPGALVRTKFLNEIREAKTDQQGEYHLVGCEPRKARIVVSAKGRATDMQEVRVESDMAPVDFSMKPGGKIRIRVVDEQGNGIPKARILFQRWRGRMDYFEFDHVSQYADKNGVWEWNEAPLDEFQADICRPDGMQLSKQPLIAREAEYVFKPAKALIVSGNVIDAKTKQPIKKFRVTPGLRNSDSRIGMNWSRRDRIEASEGKYRIRLRYDYPAHLVRIEAAGYEVAISRDIKTDEGEINLDFLLEPAEDISANILTATGKPAAEAKIALGVAGSQINIKNGAIHDGSTYATQLNADADGHFSIPSGDKPFQLVITHPAGFAHLNSDDGLIFDPIKLTPWARVEGTFRIGKQSAPNIALTIFSTMTQGIHSYGEDVPNIFTHHDVTTGKEGRFVFERVFPGKGRIGRRIMLTVDEGATEVASSLRVPEEFIAGKTTTLNLGGTGRTVIGKLAPPDNHSEKIRWSFVLIYANRYLEPPPGMMAIEDIGRNPKQFLAWRDAWKKSDNYETEKVVFQKYNDARKKLHAETSTISASIARDGTFRIDDVPEGNYVMSVRLQNRLTGKLINYPFSVPAINAEQATEPIDLGDLILEK